MTTDPVVDPPKEPEKVTAGALRTWIKEEITGALAGMKIGGGEAKTDGAPTVDIKTQVGEALASLKRKEERDKRDKDIDALLESSKVAPQNAPVERRGVEKFMKWGD